MLEVKQNSFREQLQLIYDTKISSFGHIPIGGALHPTLILLKSEGWACPWFYIGRMRSASRATSNQAFNNSWYQLQYASLSISFICKKPPFKDSSLTSLVSRFLEPSFALFPAPTLGPYPTFRKYIDRSETGISNPFQRKSSSAGGLK
jgi:hypothetical protein